jgi:hypothetical protein
MLLLLGLAIALATVPLAGGRPTALAEVRLRGTWMLMASLGIQILIISVVPDGPAGLWRLVHIASYLPAAAFVANNRRVPGILWVGIGGTLNALAIMSNGGVMPASPTALAAAGLGTPEVFTNSGAVAGANLGFLGDVFSIPSGWPLANVFSFGDVVIVLGAAYGLHRICGSRLLARRRPAAA